MKTVALVLLVAFTAPIQAAPAAPAQKRAESRAAAADRDLNLEKAASRHCLKIAADLRPEAKRKLAITSRGLMKALIKRSNTRDPLAWTRANVKRQFPGISDRQSDLLSFYVLSDLARLASAPSDLERKLEEMDEMSEMTSLRLQMMMDRRSKLMSTLSNLLKKTSETRTSMVQNLK